MRLLIILVLLIATAGLSFWNFFPKNNLAPAAMQVFSKPAGSAVFINDEMVGVTPYKNQELKSGEVKLAIGTDSASFAKVVKLNPKIITVVNRELSENLFLQAGEILTLEKGAGLAVFSTPDAAEVEVDDKKAGKTPLELSDFTPGTHQIVILREGYISRSVQVQAHKGHRLILDVTLSATEENLRKLQGSISQPTQIKKVKILPTSTGWLRVRNAPSLGGAEIAKVNSGEEFTILEEQPNWLKIRLQDGRDGWISAQYSQKL